ncbi:MAG: ROK family protein [Acidobacteria bacterium]|nr:ROK family protein [Acidobacteriota bacterium]MBI3473599.1 ROK family protein [Candidatus Solibacter usitatus]
MRSIGVTANSNVAAALVEGYRIAGPIRRYPEPGDAADTLQDMPADAVADCIRKVVERAAGGESVTAIGVGIPGILRDGVVEESPNLPQLKGLKLQAVLSAALPSLAVLPLNDADAVAAGIAATHGQLDRLVRAWTLGTGIGYGRYPRCEGIGGEGGHLVVSLDPKERFCGCGGEGHLEGIMGHRAMRLRFLDLEPEEIFSSAREGDPRCRAFVKFWHRALAAATASLVHLDGPGRFYISGTDAKLVDLSLLSLYLSEMVKMSPLQGSFFEIVAYTDELAIIGAAVAATQG